MEICSIYLFKKRIMYVTKMEDINKWVESSSRDPNIIDKNKRYINSLIVQGYLTVNSLIYDQSNIIGIISLHIDENGYIKPNHTSRLVFRNSTNRKTFPV